MNKKILIFEMVFMLIMVFGNVQAQNSNANYYKNYLNYKDVISAFNTTASQSSNLSVLALGKSAGGKQLFLFKAEANKDNPAIFVSANMCGTLPIASSGALYLSQYLADNPEMYAQYTWYVLPCGNPDAYINDLNTTSFPYNSSSVNNDMDDQVDEDGPDDLNKDGLITMMKVLHPLGKYVVDTVEIRIVKKAELTTPASKRYKLLAEGIDNDGDGKYNEDAKGGVNIANTFPYNFEHYKPEYGKYSGSETETRALLEFFSEHPEICMTVTLGTSDFLRKDFIKVSKKASAKTYKIPKRIASRVGVSPAKGYTMQQLITLISEAVPEKVVDEGFVLSLVGVEPLKEPMSSDAKAYKTLSTSFNKHIKASKFGYSFVEGTKPQAGAFETYAYYHLGLPSVAMCLWDIPNLKPDSVKKKQSRAEAFLSYNDSILKGAGFVNWTKVDHPDFESVEVGGCIKNYISNPVDSMIEKTLKTQIPWLKELPKLLPQLSVSKVVSKKVGKSTYRIEVFVENSSEISAPLAMGSFSRRPAPIVLKIANDDVVFLEGKARTRIKQVKAGQVNKYSFVLQTNKSSLDFSFDAKNTKTKPSTHQL